MNECYNFFWKLHIIVQSLAFVITIFLTLLFSLAFYYLYSRRYWRYYVVVFSGHAVTNVSNADIQLTTETLSSSSIKVSWEDYHNNVILVIDDPSYSLSLIGQNKSFETNLTEYVVNCLSANTSYSFQLCVANQTFNFSCIEGRNTIYPGKGKYNHLPQTNSGITLKNVG